MVTAAALIGFCPELSGRYRGPLQEFGFHAGETITCQHQPGFGAPADQLLLIQSGLDRFFMGSLSGGLAFSLIMLVLFQSTFTWSAPAMDAIERVVTGLGLGANGFFRNCAAVRFHGRHFGARGKFMAIGRLDGGGLSLHSVAGGLGHLSNHRHAVTLSLCVHVETVEAPSALDALPALRSDHVVLGSTSRFLR